MLLPLCFVEKTLCSLKLLFDFFETWRSERLLESFGQLLTTFPFDHDLLVSSILVLDEAGMVDSKCFAELMTAVECLCVNLVACGDNGQLSPVEAGVPFRLAVEGAGKAELTMVLRQKIDWQKEATIHAVIGKGEKAREVSFSPNLYKSFDNGWAVTLHKNQGVTVDRSFVLGSYEQYKNLSYVGMTRHSKDAHLYTSDFDFWKKEKIYERLARSQDKLSSLDYIKPEDAYSLLKSKSKDMGDTLKKVGQNIEAIGYVTQKGWTSISDKFMGDTPKRNRIRMQGSLLADVKSESDRADKLFEKKKKPNPFVYGPNKTNPFKVERDKKNLFEGGGFGQ